MRIVEDEGTRLVRGELTPAQSVAMTRGPDSASDPILPTQIKRPPLSLTPTALEREFSRGPDGKVVPDAAMQAAHAAITKAKGAADQLADAVTKVLGDASLPMPSRTKRAQSAVDVVGPKVATLLDEAAGRLRVARDAVRSSSWAPPLDGSALSVAFTVEACRVLRGLSDQERMATINKAIQENDATVLSAVFGAPSALTAVSAELREGHRLAWRRKHFPAEVEREARYARALQHVERMGSATVGFLNSLIEQDAGAKAAADAQAALDAVLGGAK